MNPKELTPEENAALPTPEQQRALWADLNGDAFANSAVRATEVAWEASLRVSEMFFAMTATPVGEVRPFLRERGPMLVDVLGQWALAEKSLMESVALLRWAIRDLVEADEANKRRRRGEAENG